jgi:hypothetical protein
MTNHHIYIILEDYMTYPKQQRPRILNDSLDVVDDIWMLTVPQGYAVNQALFEHNYKNIKPL